MGRDGGRRYARTRPTRSTNPLQTPQRIPLSGAVQVARRNFPGELLGRSGRPPVQWPSGVPTLHLDLPSARCRLVTEGNSSGATICRKGNGVAESGSVRKTSSSLSDGQIRPATPAALSEVAYTRDDERALCSAAFFSGHAKGRIFCSELLLTFLQPLCMACCRPTKGLFCSTSRSGRFRAEDVRSRPWREASWSAPFGAVPFRLKRPATERTSDSVQVNRETDAERSPCHFSYVSCHNILQPAFIFSPMFSLLQR